MIITAHTEIHQIVRQLNVLYDFEFGLTQSGPVWASSLMFALSVMSPFV